VIYNIFGAFLWTSLFVFGGYFIGNIPLVKENFEIVIIVIIFISVLPMVVEYINSLRERKSVKPTG
jgi:membrane-associated protein